MNFENTMLSERSQTQRTDSICFHLHDLCGRGESVGTESRGRGAWGGVTGRDRLMA